MACHCGMRMGRAPAWGRVWCGALLAPVRGGGRARAPAWGGLVVWCATMRGSYHGGRARASEFARLFRGNPAHARGGEHHAGAGLAQVYTGQGFAPVPPMLPPPLWGRCSNPAPIWGRWKSGFLIPCGPISSLESAPAPIAPMVASYTGVPCVWCPHAHAHAHAPRTHTRAPYRMRGRGRSGRMGRSRPKSGFLIPCGPISPAPIWGRYPVRVGAHGAGAGNPAGNPARNRAS